MKRSFSGRGRSAVQVESLEARRLFAASLSFTDSDGDLVQAAVSEGPGRVEYYAGERNLWIRDTAATSQVRISVTRAAGGDGLVTLNEIRCFNPALAIVGRQVDITHEVTTDDLNIPVAADAKISIRLGAMKGVAMYTGLQRASIIKVSDWSMTTVGQQLNAPSVDHFIVTGRADVAGTAANEYLPGNAGEEMYLGDSTTTTSEYSILSISVPGLMGDIYATGRVGTVVAHGIDGEWQAGSFDSVSATEIRGSMTATGVPHVPIVIGTVTAGSVSNLSIDTSRHDIGTVWIGGDAEGLTIRSARNLGTAWIGGELHASRIQSYGNITKVRVGTISNSDIQAGVATSFSGVAGARADFANPSANLWKLNVAGTEGITPSTEGTNRVSTPTLTRLRLVNVDSSLQVHVLDPAQIQSVLYIRTTSPATEFTWAPGQLLPRELQQILV